MFLVVCSAAKKAHFQLDSLQSVVLQPVESAAIAESVDDPRAAPAGPSPPLAPASTFEDGAVAAAAAVPVATGVIDSDVEWCCSR